MAQPHHYQEPPNASMATPYQNPEEFVRQWQQRTSRFLHAQERIAQGFAAAARAQMVYQQEFLASRARLLHWDTADSGHLTQQAQDDVQKFASLIHEIASEIRDGFTEANDLLQQAAAEPPEPVKVSPPAEEPPPELAVKSPSAEEAVADSAGEPKPVAAKPAMAARPKARTATPGQRHSGRSARPH